MRRFFAFLMLTLFVASPAIAAIETGDVAVLALPDHHAIRFTLITTGGYVGFDAGADWGVVEMQSRPPVMTTTFQIPDSIGGKVEATVHLLQPDTAGGQEAVAAYDRAHASLKPENYKGWTIFTSFTYHEISPKPTIYTVMDARATQGDVICAVHLSWPNTSARDAGFGTDMKAAFMALLDSVQGGTGPYQAAPGEVVRHPAN